MPSPDPDIWLQAQFQKASALVGGEFVDRLDYYSNAWLPARDIVASALKERGHFDPSGKIVLFTKYAPWKVSRRTSIFADRSDMLYRSICLSSKKTCRLQSLNSPFT